MSLTIDDGGLIVKDPSDVAVYVFDWATANLAAGVTITSCDFLVTALRPTTATLPTLTETGSGLGILAGNRTTAVKVTGGTLGARYELSNTIVTSETPAVTKNRKVRILVENR